MGTSMSETICETSDNVKKVLVSTLDLNIYLYSTEAA